MLRNDLIKKVRKMKLKCIPPQLFTSIPWTFDLDKFSNVPSLSFVFFHLMRDVGTSVKLITTVGSFRYPNLKFMVASASVKTTALLAEVRIKFIKKNTYPEGS
jgi:hypothetical protein